MKKMLLMTMGFAVSLFAKNLYVGDSKAEFYYDNPNAVKALVSKYGLKDTTVLYYVKVRKNGKVELSNESACCKALNLKSGKCIRLQRAKF